MFCGRGPERTTHPFEHRPKIYLPFPQGKPLALWFPQSLFCGLHRERGPERTTHPFEHRPKIYLPFQQTGETLCSVVSTGNGVLKERHTHLSTGQRYTYHSHIRENPLCCGLHTDRGPERTTHLSTGQIYLPFPHPGEPFVSWFAQGSGS